jgi:hypothetical protein
MSGYDNRRITLDPGLTMLALRGLHSRHEQYPCVDAHTRWRRAWVPALRHVWETWFPTIRALATARSTSR